jgi:hypothetical protein
VTVIQCYFGVKCWPLHPLAPSAGVHILIAHPSRFAGRILRYHHSVRDSPKKVELASRPPRSEGLTNSLQTPLALLKESVKSVPANAYAVGVVGILAAAMICIGLAAGDWQVALGGGVAVFAGMVVLRIFANPTSQRGKRRQRSKQALVLSWFCLIAFVVILIFFLGKLYFTLFAQSDQIPPPPHMAAPPDSSLRVGDVKQDVKGDGNITVGVNTGTIESENSPQKKKKKKIH